MKYFVSILFILAILILGTYVIIKNKQVNTMNTQNIKYGEVTQFHENEILQFNDFRINYLGKTSQKVDFNPNLNFTDYNFVVTALDNKERTLSWSSGTGDIAPTDFVVGNKIYQLELKISEKDNKRLADNEMIISLSENDISKYLFQLIAQLSLLPKYDLDTLTKTLGFSFKETGSSNQYFNIFTSDGFSPISHAELRVNKNDLQKKLLILEIDKATNILDKTIMERYPKAQINVHSPNDPTHKSFSVSKSWGKISFGFNRNDILTNISLDSIE